MLGSQLESISSMAGKGLIIVGLLVYLLFVILIIRQIDLMAKTFTTHHESVMRLLGYIYLGLVLMMIVVALVWL